MLRLLPFGVLAVLLVALQATAQSQDPAASPPESKPQDSPAPTEAKKPKKVVTNEDLPKSVGEISVVGDAKGAPKATSGKPANAQYVGSVRGQLEKLQKQIDDVDKQIVDLKNFRDGEPSTTASGVKFDKSVEREPIEVRIRALQNQKKDLQSKIDALLDEARKKGVEPGELR